MHHTYTGNIRPFFFTEIQATTSIPLPQNDLLQNESTILESKYMLTIVLEQVIDLKQITVCNIDVYGHKSLS